MITQRIIINEREIPLLFDLAALAEITDQIGEMSDFGEMFKGHKRVKNTIKLIVILGNEGLEVSGQKPDLTEKFVGRHLHPSELMTAQMACINAVTDGMRVETKQDEDKPRDLTLEEIEKKSTP